MFDPRFINVLDEGAGGDDLTTALGAAFSRLSRASASGPFTLYISRSCTFAGTLAVLHPPVLVQFSWVFAPGAVISMEGGSTLEIDEDLDLTNGRHFDLEAGATVRLRGRLEGVRPEWFGVATSADDALRHAVSILVDRFLSQREQVPLLLSGSYHLLRPVRIDLPAGAESSGMEVRVVGRHPYGDSATPPTFVIEAGYGASVALVVGRGVRLRIRHVAFRSDDPAESASSGLLTFEGANDGSEVDRCTFFVSIGVGIRVMPSGVGPVIRTFEPAVIARENSSLLVRQHGVQPHEQLQVRDSWFESLSGSTTAPVMIRLEGMMPRVRLSLERCVFRGVARAMVAAAAGVLIITSCSFETDSGDDGNDGADLLLGTLAVENASDAVSGAIHLVETHVRTSSAVHLRCDRQRGGNDSTVSITGLRHIPPLGRPASVAEFIRWRGPVGSGLLLQGCSIAGRVALESPSDRIVLLAADVRLNDGVTPIIGHLQRAELPLWPLWAVSR